MMGIESNNAVVSMGHRDDEYMVVRRQLGRKIGMDVNFGYLV